jgi:hypothetical protein
MGEPVEDACKISKGAGLGPSHLWRGGGLSWAHSLMGHTTSRPIVLFATIDPVSGIQTRIESQGDKGHRRRQLDHVVSTLNRFPLSLYPAALSSSSRLQFPFPCLLKPVSGPRSSVCVLSNQTKGVIDNDRNSPLDDFFNSATTPLPELAARLRATACKLLQPITKVHGVHVLDRTERTLLPPCCYDPDSGRSWLWVPPTVPRRPAGGGVLYYIDGATWRHPKKWRRVEKLAGGGSTPTNLVASEFQRLVTSFAHAAACSCRYELSAAPQVRFHPRAKGYFPCWK